MLLVLIGIGIVVALLAKGHDAKGQNKAETGGVKYNAAGVDSETDSSDNEVRLLSRESKIILTLMDYICLRLQGFGNNNTRTMQHAQIIQ